MAYSKICSHAGCSVGLFGIDNRAARHAAPAGVPVPPVDVRSRRRRRARSAARAPRPLPQLPLAVDAEGYPRRPGRLQRSRRPDRLGRGVSLRAPAGPASASERHGDGVRGRSRRERRRPTSRTWHRTPTATAHHRGLVERYVESVTGRVGADSFVGKVLHKVFPNHFSFLWGELALYSFMVLLITGVYLTLFFEGSQQVLVYDGSYQPLQGVEVSAAYDSVMRISLRRQGRAADPPDAPLGGARVRRRHRPAHGPGVLHRRVPPAPRAQLGRRPDPAAAGPGRRVHRATRCPTTCCRAPGCASPRRSSSPSRSSASGSRT